MVRNTDKKYLCVVMLGILVGTSLLAGCIGGEKKVDVRYGGQYYPGEFLLEGKNFWEKYGLNVEHILFSSGSENNQALISGEIDINCGSDSKTVALFNAIPDRALIIGTLQRGDRYSTVVRADSNYHSWEDLKGKTVATRLGTGAEQVLRRYFEQSENLSWNDFNWVNLKIEDMISALESGTIEAFTAWEPTPSIAEAQGVGRILRTYGDIALVPVCLHTTVEFAQKHREEIVKFLAAQMDKADMIKNNPEKAAQLAAQAASKVGYNVSADAFERVFKRINFIIDFDGKILDAINDTAHFLYEQGKIDKIPQLRWDRSFIEEAKTLREKE
ncbi:MAG: ABC transporter substrate-binding protein [Thermoplasmata archaeon]|nr:ABC transporter substrate-binding protein [Thermoplasmata archaeon]